MAGGFALFVLPALEAISGSLLVAFGCVASQLLVNSDVVWNT